MAIAGASSDLGAAVIRTPGQLWQLSGDCGGESRSWACNPASGLYLHQSASDPAVIDTAPWDGGTEAESFFPV